MDEKEFVGNVIEESLDDNRVLNEMQIVAIKITGEIDPDKRWHIYKIAANKNEIEKLWVHLKDKWYMHFWKGENITVYFKGKKFDIFGRYKSTWSSAIEYGKSLGIPEEQLDFPTD
jgi:hypothetical protein